MFLGAHFSNSISDLDFCKNVSGLTDFAKYQHRSTDLLTPIHPTPKLTVTKKLVSKFLLMN